MSTEAPRVLITGFGPFPGAPENPTERLIEVLTARKWALPRDARLHLAVLPVDYDALPKELVALGKAFCPDIAIHFGLSAEARGFTLERLARNETRADKPDNKGELRSSGMIREGVGDIASSLPLKAIEQALADSGLQVYWSDDAGGYLCNYLFFLSRGHFCEGFSPSMAGFIHVPLLTAGGMTIETLESGAVKIVETCCQNWQPAHHM